MLFFVTNHEYLKAIEACQRRTLDNNVMQLIDWSAGRFEGGKLAFSPLSEKHFKLVFWNTANF